MSKLPLLAGAVGAALLAGCQSEPSNVTTVVETSNETVIENKAVVENGTAPVGAAITLAGDGLGKVSFGTARESTVPMIESVLGAHTGQGTNLECGAGPLDNVDYPGGLTLLFQDNKFVGWSVDGRDGSPYRTANQIGIGSTLQQLRDAGDVAVQDTSLGVEFSAGEISGLATANNPSGKVTNLWAGTTCAFR